MADQSAALAHEAEHPGEPTYISLLVILAIITIVEVAVYYIDALRDVLVPILVVLSLIKFTGVVGWFMHLRFDNRLLTGVFVSCLLIAAAVAIAVVAMAEYNDFWVGQHFKPE